MARLNRAVRKVHRLAAYVVGVQVLLWVLGGLVFAWVPFDSLIKGGAVLREPVQAPLPDDWRMRLAAAEESLGPILRVESQASGQGTLLLLTASSGEHWLRLSDGELDPQPVPEQLQSYASALYGGPGSVQPARYLSDSEYRVLGLVDEMYGRTGVWQVPFDDSYGTRFYFDGATGAYLTVRNDFWVLYDAMWRLHIMDYGNGRDFNNPLLTAFATFAGIFVISGVFLAYFALRRLWR